MNKSTLLVNDLNILPLLKCEGFFMKFLLITESEIETEPYLKMYMGDYIEHISDVLHYEGIPGAKSFVIRELIENQKHIDFIIADFHSNEFYEAYKEFAIWMRECFYTYSSQNFKLSAIPIFLMNNAMNLERLFYSTLQEQIDRIFDGIVYKPEGYKRIGVTNNTLSTGIDYWLDKLRSDLDDLDLDIHSNFANVNRRILSARSYKLRVLSSSFVNNNKPVDYLWVGNRLQIVESTADRLAKLLKTYQQNPSKRNEKEIHQFLISYDHLLKSENFHKCIYEQHFYHKGTRSYEEVDFWNISHTYALTDHEFFEVKLPSQRFYNRHTLNLLKSTQKYFHQIGSKYYKYFSSQANSDEIREKAAKHDVTITNLNFQYSLLMGRDEDKDQNLASLHSFTSTLSANVRLLTYDDLMSRHHYLHLRVTRFGII